MWAYVEILLICNFHPSRSRNYATTIISKLNNFAEVLAVRVHVDVYMATAALRSITGESLCDTRHRTRYTFLLPTNPPPPNPTTLNHLYLFFLRLRRKKIIDGKMSCNFSDLSPKFGKIGQKIGQTFLKKLPFCVTQKTSFCTSKI